MNKSELKKRILESLTPDEASKVDVKYKEIYAGMVGKNPLKMKKYDNPDKVAYGRAINLIKKESAKLSEKLGKDADLGDHIEDFQKSDAPQFKGKSKKKINQMAQAAFLNKEEQKLDEIDDMMEDAQDKSEKNYSNYFKKMDKNKLEEFVKEALKNPKKADLNKDGELSSYEKARATAIEKSIDKVDETKKGDELQQDLAKGKRDTIKDSTGYLIDLILDFMKDNPSVSPEQVSSQFKKLLDPDEIRGYLETTKTNESFDSLSKDIDKQKGKTKEDGDNIAGSIAAKKRAGAGKGPTAKQKKRMAETILKELRK